jgi:hypothetical protein
MERIDTRVPFHDHRERALVNPELARDQLAHYAVLHVTLVKAIELEAADDNIFSESSSDPYAMVLVEDSEVARTPTVNCNLNPEWNYTTDVDIHTANDIVQFQVMDEDALTSDDLLGFVEFAVGDLTPNEPVKGWLSLTKKERLQGTSEQRLEKAMAGKDLDMTTREGETEHEKVAGSILVEMCLHIVGPLGQPGDASDQFYAFCMPKRPSKEYPVTGYRRDHESLNAQAFWDSVELPARTVMENLVWPSMAFVEYVLTWQEAWFSLLHTCGAVFAALYPMNIFPVVCFLQGVFLLSTSSRERRKRMFLNPYSVPVNDEGYARISSTNSSDKMRVFLERVVKAMQGHVLNMEKFAVFAAFAADGGKPVTTYRDLKAQLPNASDIDSPFVSFPTAPLKDDTLVLWHDDQGCVREGKIVSCASEKANPMVYVVKIGEGKEEFQEKIKADDLEVRLDLRWMNSAAVLALIPDGLEDAVSDLQPTIDGVGRQAVYWLHKCEAVVTWENKFLATCITVAFFAASVLFGWIALKSQSAVSVMILWLIKVALACGVAFPHIWFAHFFVKVRTRCTAQAAAKQHAATGPSTWPFFTADPPAAAAAAAAE